MAMSLIRTKSFEIGRWPRGFHEKAHQTASDCTTDFIHKHKKGKGNDEMIKQVLHQSV